MATSVGDRARPESEPVRSLRSTGITGGEGMVGRNAGTPSVLGGDDVIGRPPTEAHRSGRVRRDRGDEKRPVDDLDDHRVVETASAKLGLEGNRCVEPHRRPPSVDELGEPTGGDSTVGRGGRTIVMDWDRQHGVHCAESDDAVLEDHVEIAWCRIDRRGRSVCDRQK
jgi:hypothetical protein